MQQPIILLCWVKNSGESQVLCVDLDPSPIVLSISQLSVDLSVLRKAGKALYTGEVHPERKDEPVVRMVVWELKQFPSLPWTSIVTLCKSFNLSVPQVTVYTVRVGKVGAGSPQQGISLMNMKGLEVCFLAPLPRVSVQVKHRALLGDGRGS